MCDIVDTMSAITFQEQNRASENQADQPEWIRVADVKRLFGIGRSKVYELIQSQKIGSVSLRETGQTRGTRLVSCEGMRAYLADLSKQQQGQKYE